MSSSAMIVQISVITKRTYTWLSIYVVDEKFHWNSKVAKKDDGSEVKKGGGIQAVGATNRVER